MTKYLRRPVVVDAVRWIGIIKDLDDAFGEIPLSISFSESFSLNVSTLEGTMKCGPGDWLVRGVKGEYYPVKAEIFPIIYEEVRDEQVD